MAADFQAVTQFEPTARDAVGKRIFAAGDVGTAHVVAHRLVDEGRFDLGRVWLGDWLANRTGSSSEWIHLQFHMAVFELATGAWEAARQRFAVEIMPPAATTSLALTDAPALAWRLALAADSPVLLPWHVLMRTALNNIDKTADDFVTLHHLLAVAGAGDSAAIERWLATQARNPVGRRRTVVAMAHALRSAVAGRYPTAVRKLEQLLPALGRLGGSGAQNSLFEQMRAHWERKAASGELSTLYRAAA